ncbi:hypothetical protein GCM10010329_18180 [Streptomyces spiroverticillatus]|uniref:Uncharacterized protein n=1 Tax=Streptomyces finlayi TaxID=67296 RepID=A0A918WTL9_9ACTN|nr:hypothetical protein [Streptomyces finlayi]GGZ97253.1 hypothetical protein GCM10010329_18180 [Streptomyces spiroverticillatus]GHC82427.1 hypothetical protein GCM10010334_10660 [Streptomyces finlayi]
MSNHSNEQYPYQQGYGQQPSGEYGQDPYAPSYGDQPHQAPAPAQDPYSTQTWQGQTWDTQYQPVQPASAAADTAYLPPQNQSSYDSSYGSSAYGSQPTGSQPLPPEVPVQQPQPDPEPPQQQHTPAAGVPQAHAPYDIPPAPAYSSPATRGNTRITDAQRARAEGRSPIIEPGMKPALITAVLGALLAGAAVFGQFALVVPVVLLQAVTAAGWFRLNGMWPARQGIALAFLGGLVADVAILVVDGLHAPAAILGTLGIWVLLTLVLHLRNSMPADERMYALTAGVTTAALAVVASGHLAANPKAMTVGGIAVAVAVFARALPLPTIASVAVALLAAAGSGIAVGGANGVGSGGALIGLGAGVCALIGLRVASYDYPSKFVHMTAGVALPLTAAAPAVYLLGRAFA